MNRIGLALSGGGFRATLYHLGLVRFLRDAGLLSQVTHITSVSGGSVFAAHLVLNWDLYNGSPNDFDAAASKLLSIVRMDVRNRIVRRALLNGPSRWPRRLLGLSNRKLTRTGLLEHHYEKHLYGDTGLFELPESPQLHILATNLTEGCLCSFTRDGLLMMRRQPGHRFRVDRIPIGLATVPMAVAASSAFPGFFPPLDLTGADVGASVGEFGRQAYTGGGVFDSRGVRMVRSLDRSLLGVSPLSPDDFFDFPAVLEALREASQASEETPLRRLPREVAGRLQRRGRRGYRGERQGADQHLRRIPADAVPDGDHPDGTAQELLPAGSRIVDGSAWNNRGCGRAVASASPLGVRGHPRRDLARRHCNPELGYPDCANRPAYSRGRASLVGGDQRHAASLAADPADSHGCDSRDDPDCANRFLGTHGLCGHGRVGRRYPADPGGPSGPLCHLVPHQADWHQAAVRCSDESGGSHRVKVTGQLAMVTGTGVSEL